jgi:sugar phosphate isomerase/epimerase
MTSRRPLGVCTWTFGNLPLNDIARRIAKLGYNGVELMGNLQAYQAAEANQILQNHNLQIFSLTPDNVDLAHPDSAVRAKATDYYLRLLDFAAALGQPLVSCHGYVGRVRPLNNLAQEKQLFVRSVQTIAERAQTLKLRLVIEVLNRYEAHLVNTAAQAADFLAKVGAENVGILLDAYHMNIEESDPAEAIRLAADRLWLYHAADSNRQGIGQGHTNFNAQLTALSDINYRGPIIIECTAPGPDPFTPIKTKDSIKQLETCLQESRARLR